MRALELRERTLSRDVAARLADANADSRMRAAQQTGKETQTRKQRATCHAACRSMFLVMVLESTLRSRGYGILLRSPSFGSSVASAREANESMMRFTHNIFEAATNASALVR